MRMTKRRVTPGCRGDDIQDAIYINMDEIDDAVDVEEIIKK
jgi:hypothetical protein